MLLLYALALLPAQIYGQWQSCRIGGGGYVQNVVFCPSDPRRLYTYIDVGGAYRSDDAGATWKMLHATLPQSVPGHEVRGLIVDPRNADRVLLANELGLYQSLDGGKRWNPTLKANFKGNSPWRWAGFVLDRNPSRPDMILAASLGDGVYRSEDGGTTWTPFGLRDVFSTDVRFDRRPNGNAWLCAVPTYGKQGGFSASKDGGKTWEKRADASPEEVVQDPRQPQTLYGIFQDQIIRRSLDGGRKWTDWSEGLPIAPLDPDNYVGPHRFQALTAGPDFILTASTSGDFYRLEAGSRIWTKIARKSIEQVAYGKPWFNAGEHTFANALASISIDPRDPRHWFFTDWYAAYETHDEGAKWSLRVDGIEDTVLHCLAQDPSDPKVVHLGMADMGYFRSEDAGTTFQRMEGISNNVKCLSLCLAKPSRLYAVGPKAWDWAANQVFVTANGGRNWSRAAMKGLPDMTKSHCNSIVCDPNRPDTAYLAVSGAVSRGAGGVYRTKDAGATWEWFGEGLPSVSFFRHDIWSGGNELAVDASGNLFAIGNAPIKGYRLDRGSSTWQAAFKEINSTPSCVVADRLRTGTFYLATWEGLFSTQDGGAKWSKVLANGVEHVETDSSKSGRVAASTDNGIQTSEDGGKTWRKYDASLPSRHQGIPVFVGDRMVVGTNGSGAFWTKRLAPKRL